jgi:putative membrane protein
MDERPETEDGSPSEVRGWRRAFLGGSVAVGRDPDYRFSLANERTFLAWIRTALALLAGGLGVEKFLPEFAGRTVLAVLLAAMGLILAGTSYHRWALNEIALRTGRPLPASRQPLLLALGVTLAGLTIAVLVVFGGR